MTATRPDGDRAGALDGVAGETVAAVSGVILALVLVALKWYGFAGSGGTFAPRAARLGPETGWHALTSLRWLLLATSGAAIVALMLRLALRTRASPQAARVSTITGELVAGAGAVTLALLCYRVVIDFPGNGAIVDQKLGAVIGMLAAAGVTVGGVTAARRTRPDLGEV